MSLSEKGHPFLRVAVRYNTHIAGDLTVSSS